LLFTQPKSLDISPVERVGVLIEATHGERVAVALNLGDQVGKPGELQSLMERARWLCRHPATYFSDVSQFCLPHGMCLLRCLPLGFVCVASSKANRSATGNAHRLVEGALSGIHRPVGRQGLHRLLCFCDRAFQSHAHELGIVRDDMSVTGGDVPTARDNAHML